MPHKNIVRWTVCLIFLAVGSAQCKEPPIRDRGVRAKAEREPLFGTLRIPYEGRGSLAVLNNGLIKLEVPADGSEPGEEHVVYLFADMQGLTLVEADGQWFLDRDDAMVKSRGVLPSRVSQIAFDEGAVPDFKTTRQTILDVEDGQVVLAFDAKTHVYHLAIQSANGDVEFTMNFRGASDEGPAGRAAGGSGPESEQAGGGGCAGNCSCNAKCPNGTQCSITCINDCCVCYCGNNAERPVCECRPQPPAKVVLIP